MTLTVGASFRLTTKLSTVVPASLTERLAGVTVNVRAVDDAIDETSPHTSTIVTSATSSTNPGFNGVAVADVTVAITDDDTAGISITQSSGGTAVSEAGGTDTYSIVLDSQPSASVGVTVSFPASDLTVNGNAVGSYSTSFTIANWNTPQTITVAAVDDRALEGNHAGALVHAFTSSDAAYQGITARIDGNSSNSLTANITDNETAVLEWIPAIGSVGEGVSNATTVRLDITAIPAGGTPTLEGTIVADVGLNLGNAEANDFGAITPSVTFTNVADLATVPVTAVHNSDTLVEGNETYVLTLSISSAPLGTSVSPTPFGGFQGIINDAQSATVTLTGSTTVSEAVGSTPLTVTLNAGAGNTIEDAASVVVNLADGSASYAGGTGDYFFNGPNNTATVNFAAGSADGATRTVPVNIREDVLVEASESFAASFGGSTGAVLAAGPGATLTIEDNEAATVSFQAPGSTVGEASTPHSVNALLTITAVGSGTASLSAPLTVAVTQTPGTAATPADYTLSTPSVSFAAGSQSGATQPIAIAIVDDNISESDETFALGFGVLTGTGTASGSHTVTITDNDTPGVTVIESGGTTIVAEGGGTDSFTVVLTSQPIADVVIALTGTQVSAAPAPLTFTPGNWNQVQTVTVTAIDDAIDEADPHAGHVAFALSSVDPVYNGLPASALSVQVGDNDTAGVIVSESNGSTAVTEGGATDSYTVVLASEPTSDVSIAITTGTQFSVSPGSLVFTPANWNMARTVTVTAVDDGVVEGPQTGVLSHAASSADPGYNGIAVAGFTVSITDNDSAVVGFAPAAVSQAEGMSPMMFTVTLSNPVASGVTLTVNSSNGSAGAADFTPIVAGTVTFAPSSMTAQTVNVTIANDALDEDDETFGLTLSGLTATGNVSLGAASATGTIVDDDATPTLSITSPSQPEGDVGPTVMDFVVSLSAVSGRDVSFTRATGDATATVANNDYVAIPAGSVTIPAGDISVTIPVTINGDTTFEGDETFAVNLTGITNATPGTLTGTGTIEDDDQQPTTTVIDSRTPVSTVVGESYAVAVTVSAQTLSPTGSVTISDGSASCSAPLAAGAAPAATMSCSLASTTAGTKTLTASYTPDSTAFGESSGTASHPVTAAATTISVTGPARSRINQPTGFSFALDVTAPGGGTPTGTVTLSSGTASCTATLPATGCDLNFATLGSRTVTASYASDGNFASSTSSELQTLVFALSDLSISKTDGEATYEPGDLIVYTVQVRNAGPDVAAQVRVQDIVPTGLSAVTWTCDASGGAVCSPTSGVGDLEVTLASLPVGALWNYTFYGTVAGAPEQIVNTATLGLPADTTVEDPNVGNNSATVVSLLESLFANGFEAPLVAGPEGSYRLPTAVLAPVLDEVARVVFKLDDKRGEMARVYARVHLGAVEYALATRAADGRWTLGPWTGYVVDPSLSWNAQLTAGGWQLTRVELR